MGKLPLWSLPRLLFLGLRGLSTGYPRGGLTGPFLRDPALHLALNALPLSERLDESTVLIGRKSLFLASFLMGFAPRARKSKGATLPIFFTYFPFGRTRPRAANSARNKILKIALAVATPTLAEGQKCMDMHFKPNNKRRLHHG